MESAVLKPLPQGSLRKERCRRELIVRNLILGRRIVAILVLLMTGLGVGLNARLYGQSLSAHYLPTITTVAGTGTGGYTGDNGPATAAQLLKPASVAYDPSGNLYVIDNYCIVRKIDAVTGIITTVAGQFTGGYSGDNGPAINAQFKTPNDISFDRSGNLYIADTNNYAVRMIQRPTNGDMSQGIVMTVLGIPTSSGNVTKGVLATTSKMTTPNGVVVDAAGNLFATSSGEHVVVEVPVATGLTVVVAGMSSKQTVAGDGGPATSASFSGPRSVAVDSVGNLYILDKNNNAVRKVDTTGIITTYAGQNSATGGNTGDGGLAKNATLNQPNALFVDLHDNLYIALQGSNSIRKVDAQTQIITTVAGSGVAGYTGDGGAAFTAALSGPTSMAVSPDGTKLAIADATNNVVRVVTMDNVFPATPVGTPSSVHSINVQPTAGGTAQSYQITPGAPSDFTFGTLSGCVIPGVLAANSVCAAPLTFAPTAPGLRVSQAVLTDSTGYNYVLGLSGVGNAPAVAIGPGTISTYAGTGSAGWSGDGSASASAQLSGPGGAALDVAGNLYIADTANNVVRRVDALTKNISTVAGTNISGYSGDGGLPTAAQLNAPTDVAIDPSGNIYIAEAGNHVVREISFQSGLIKTVAGNNTLGFGGDGGLAPAASLDAPSGIATDANGNLYIADTQNHRVRVVNAATGIISTFAGTGAPGYSGDGESPTAATLNLPSGIAVDLAGNVYIADTGNNVIRKVSGNVISTLAGNNTAGSSGDDGPALSAQLNAPTRVAIDAAGDIYIADYGNSSIREVSAQSGNITTVVGKGIAGFAGDGGAATSALLNTPNGIALDAQSNIYIADTANNRVARVDVGNVSNDFGRLSTGTTSESKTYTFTNFGNQTLTITGVTVPSGFQTTPVTGTDCSTITSLSPGGSCMVGVVFAPSTNGPFPGQLSLTDNALNQPGSTQVVNLNGFSTGVAAIAVSGGDAQTTCPGAQFQTPLQALVTDNTGAGVGGVVVTFTALGTGATGTFANGSATATATTGSDGVATAPALTGSMVRGSFSVSATVTAISTSATFSETIAGNPSPTVTLSISPASTVTYGQNAAVTATLAPSSMDGNNISGTVTFYDNGASAGTATVSNGQATWSYLPNAGTHNLTAAYSGDSNFSVANSATAATLTVTPAPVTVITPSISQPYGSAIPVLTATLTGTLAQDAGKVTPVLTTTAKPASPAGTYPINVTGLTGSAASNYQVGSIQTSTGGTPAFTITQAGNTVALTVPASSVGIGSSVTTTATVTSNVSGAAAGTTPSGTVTFSDGTTVLGTSNLNSSGLATYTTSSLTAGTHSLTVAYAGSQDYTASTSQAVVLTVVSPDFTFGASNTSLTMQQGQRGYVPLTFTANLALAGTVTLGCGGLPTYATCTFTPPSVTLVANGTSTSMLLIQTAGPTTLLHARNDAHHSALNALFACVLLPGLVVGGVFSMPQRRKLRKAIFGIVALAVLSACISGLVGCGGGSTSSSDLATPPGTATVTVTATSSSGAVHTTTVSLTTVAAH